MKSHLSRGLVLAALFTLLAILSTRPAAAATWVRIPGSPPVKVIQMSFSKGQIVLKTEGNRMFTVPLDTPGLEIFLDGEKEGNATALPATVVPGGVLTLQDIVKMLGEGTSEETLAAFIEASQTRYVLSKGSLADLQKAGASDTFIQFLLRTGRSSPGLTLGIQGQQQGGPAQEPDAGTDAGTLAPYPVTPTDYNAPGGGIPLDWAYGGMGYGAGYGVPGYGYSYPINPPLDPGYYPCPVPCDYCGGPAPHRGRRSRVTPTTPPVTARPSSGGITISGGTSGGAAANVRLSRAADRLPVTTPQYRAVMRRNNMPLGLAPQASSQPTFLTRNPSGSSRQAATLVPRPQMGQVGQMGQMNRNVTSGTPGMGPRAPLPANSRVSLGGGVVARVPIPFLGRTAAPGSPGVPAPVRAQAATSGVPAAVATPAPSGVNAPAPAAGRARTRGRAAQR